jgi:hypothetical protein
MQMRRLLVLAMTAALLMVVTAPALAGGGPPPKGDDGDRVRVVVYVESQGLFFESIVGPNLPPNGPFQELRPGDGPGGTLATEFGPGDPGYLGGRWWVDANGSGELDEGDAFFSCPLLGKGSATPPA